MSPIAKGPLGEVDHPGLAGAVGRALLDRDDPRLGGDVDDGSVADDLMAFGALDALRANRTPAQDCWVIGYDDVDVAAWDSFSLTTVRQPSREMAWAGAKMLLERIHAPGEPPRRVNFPCDLIVRGSTGLAGAGKAGPA
jgi:DNA-binding LacI/PurR family transcriptional regulator